MSILRTALAFCMGMAVTPSPIPIPKVINNTLNQTQQVMGITSGEIQGMPALVNTHLSDWKITPPTSDLKYNPSCWFIHQELVHTVKLEESEIPSGCTPYIPDVTVYFPLDYRAPSEILWTGAVSRKMQNLLDAMLVAGNHEAIIDDPWSRILKLK